LWLSSVSSFGSEIKFKVSLKMSRHFALSRVAWTLTDSLSKSLPCTLHGTRRAGQRSVLPRVLGVRSVQSFTQGDLKQLLPTMMDLGLQKGDRGEL